MKVLIRQRMYDVSLRVPLLTLVPARYYRNPQKIDPFQIYRNYWILAPTRTGFDRGCWSSASNGKKTRKTNWCCYGPSPLCVGRFDNGRPCCRITIPFWYYCPLVLLPARQCVLGAYYRRVLPNFNASICSFNNIDSRYFILIFCVHTHTYIHTHTKHTHTDTVLGINRLNFWELIIFFA